ncbi:MAG: leucyl aminopeptidase family protein [Paracoccaceae bacterium]
MNLSFAAPADHAIALHVIESEELDDFIKGQSKRAAEWINANEFKAHAGQVLLIPSADGQPEMALAGYGSASNRARRRFTLAGAAAQLPEGNYRIVSAPSGANLSNEALGWLLSGYVFDRYKSKHGMSAKLIAPDGVEAHRIETLANAESLTRDLINTPAADMGPDELEQATRDLAGQYDATVNVIAGDALLEQNLPMIHAVGRASTRAPRLIDMRWGSAGPTLTLVGKGVCFDTGGLNLKPGGSMGLMKKDMGGAANVIGLAKMIMALKLPIRLRVLIPAVENSVSGSAMRPGDILTSRKGLTVEINNTDAEGRLVLADALALGAEDKPDLMISMATLTGAARVAVGPDIAPYFTDNDAFSAALVDAAKKSADPVWRMPFHQPYEAMIEPAIADLDNAPGGGMAGAITAALFLRRFAGDTRYVHFDIFGWNAAAAPGRSKGGAGQGPRALVTALPEVLGL